MFVSNTFACTRTLVTTKQMHSTYMGKYVIREICDMGDEVIELLCARPDKLSKETSG